MLRPDADVAVVGVARPAGCGWATHLSLRSAAAFMESVMYCMYTAFEGCSPSIVQPVRPEHEPTVLLHSIIFCKSCTCTAPQTGSEGALPAACAC